MKRLSAVVARVTERIRTRVAPCRFGRYAMVSKASPYGEHYGVTFVNGYGASVIRSAYSYGGNGGLFELAVIGADGHLCYDTPITCDVIGWLTRADVASLLERIESL